MQPNFPTDSGPAAGNSAWILQGHVKLGQRVFEVEAPTAKNGFTTTMRAGVCKGCENVVQSPNDARGCCCRCGYVMCTACVGKLACFHCRRPVCGSCGHTRPWVDWWACNDHR